jgi:hypothetical protein
MARDATSAAMTNSTTGQGLSKTYGDRATATSNILTPTLNQMATAPQGFGKQTVGNMTTAALQGAGGAQAATVGGGIQRAAGTNNAGAFDASAGQAGHDATSALTDAALGVQNRDAELKQQQQQFGVQGLNNQYQTNVGAGENALGISDAALNTSVNAGKSGWFQNMTGLIGAVNGNGAGSAAAIAKYCWIAEAIYGVDSVKTHTVRHYLNTTFRETLRGKLTMMLYGLIGRKVAWCARRSKTVRMVLKPLFDSALRSAEAC